MFGSLKLNLPHCPRGYRLCPYCDYYPATERSGACCRYCISDDDQYMARLHAQREEKARIAEAQQAEAARIAEAKQAEAARKKAEKLALYQKANVTAGKSFADCLKKH